MMTSQALITQFRQNLPTKVYTLAYDNGKYTGEVYN